MDNPYSTQSTTETPREASGRSAPAWIALASVGAIVANYTTTTSMPSELWDVFAHVVLLTAPVSLFLHSSNLIASLYRKAPSINRWLYLALLPMPVSFVVSISSYFSNNPFETFAAENRFFGPYAWALWAWLIVLGLLPFLEFVPTIHRWRLAIILLSLTAIGFHLHNEYWVWQICHMKP
jgi:hypothetical protein